MLMYFELKSNQKDVGKIIGLDGRCLMRNTGYGSWMLDAESWILDA